MNAAPTCLLPCPSPPVACRTRWGRLNRLMGFGHRLMDFAHPLQLFGHRLMGFSDALQYSGHRLMGFTHRLQLSGHRLMDFAHPLQLFGHRLMDSANRLHLFGHGLMGSGHPLQLSGNRLMGFSDALQGFGLRREVRALLSGSPPLLFTTSFPTLNLNHHANGAHLGPAGSYLGLSHLGRHRGTTTPQNHEQHQSHHRLQRLHQP